MRLLLALALLILTGLVVASAADLGVEGGVIQSFQMEADIPPPPSACDDASSGTTPEQSDVTQPPNAIGSEAGPLTGCPGSPDP